MSDLTEHARQNRAHWDATADDYQERHGAFIGRLEPRWGLWQIPESELGILGDVTGKDVLEFGCGAAQALVEPRPDVGATSTYWEASEFEWARRWPSECIWKAWKR